MAWKCARKELRDKAVAEIEAYLEKLEAINMATKIATRVLTEEHWRK